MRLICPTEQQILQVKSWFSDHHAIFTWGGPNMTYPMSDEHFLKQLTPAHINSFCLINDEQELVAFGQFYNRLEHHHLGRLTVNPKNRGQGWSKILITLLLKEAFSKQSAKGTSLFVFRDNTVAYRCYQSLGFVETDYPEEPFPGNMQNCAYMVLPAELANFQL